MFIIKNFFKTKRVETKVCGFITNRFVNFRLYFYKISLKYTPFSILGVNKTVNIS